MNELITLLGNLMDNQKRNFIDFQSDIFSVMFKLGDLEHQLSAIDDLLKEKTVVITANRSWDSQLTNRELFEREGTLQRDRILKLLDIEDRFNEAAKKLNPWRSLS